MARNTMHGEKVPFYKTWWFWVIIILFIYGFVTGVNSDDEEESEESSTSQESSMFEDYENADYDTDFVCMVIKGCEELLL